MCVWQGGQIFYSGLSVLSFLHYGAINKNLHLNKAHLMKHFTDIVVFILTRNLLFIQSILMFILGLLPTNVSAA